MWKKPELPGAPEPFNPEQLLAVLARHDVRYVLIGGIAAVFHGSPLQTNDADICPARQRGNLDRLADALDEIGAVSDSPAVTKWAEDPALLGKVDFWNLKTPLGRFDIALYPAGTRGYEDLARDAIQVEIGEHAVLVASLEDIIRSKDAAGRPKDRLGLPILRELLDRTREKSDD